MTEARSQKTEDREFGIRKAEIFDFGFRRIDLG